MTRNPTPCDQCLRLGIEPKTKERDRYLHPDRYDNNGQPIQEAS